MGNAVWAEAWLALNGALRLARGDRGGLACFDCSHDGFWRSFRAAAITYPLYLVLLTMRVSVAEWQRSGGWRIVIVETIGYVIAWVAFPLLMIEVTRWIGRANRFFDFMVPYNWCQVPQSALFVLVGVVLFRRSFASRTRDLGRVAIGLGLMLFALEQLLALLTPYEDVPSLRLLMGAIATQPVIDVIIAAAMTWAAHSSVATVLLTMSLAAQGVVPPHAAFALVLGANLGSALNPLLEGAPGGDPRAKRVPIGNLLNRAVGVVLGLALLGWIGPWLVTVEPDAARAVADFHTLFNLAIAAIFLPLLRPFAGLLVRMLPARAAAADPSQPVYLNNAARETPAIALADAAREGLRMADVLQAMLRGALDAIDHGDRKQVATTKGLDDVLDRLNRAIKTYLTELDPDLLDDDDSRRLSEILAFITNLEHAGDIVERSLMALAAKRLRRGLAFSVEGQAEIRAMLERLAGNVHTAAAVFMTDDARAARALLGEKEVFRDLEARATETHFARVRAGRVESVETSALHLDVLRDLKRINAHVAAAAYAVLEKRGELLPSRLRRDAETAP